MTKLVDLIGLHTLTGFDTCIPRKKGLDDGVCFILDGKKYQIYTDGADGYRSYLSELFEEDIECRNMIPSEPVLITENGNPNAEGITMYSMNGKKIVEIYTDEFDNWYPCAICNWFPENLVVNSEDNDCKKMLDISNQLKTQFPEMTNTPLFLIMLMMFWNQKTAWNKDIVKEDA